jgi:uncharacterized BrkB/YihY/UPF0761 family membrane protein
MLRVLSLLWTLMLSLVVTGVSFFYVRGENHGFPFTFSRGVTDQGTESLQFNAWSVVLDVLFWWFLFSVLWIILKNYIFET